ncbi:polyadenylated RNA binding protein [Coprinopsis sp. MPI-PUGE-AT-0042]|nr:polyadenylated RNA binding protein [Coprinopsis sp. MPI-PUGE-AT-0042]
MPFGLTIGTERANVFQQAIQDELTRRGYSPEADPVMAEYITIMVINNKTPEQITSELEDLIATEIDASFIGWLFEEAAKGATGPDAAAPPSVETPSEPARQPSSSRDAPSQAIDSNPRRQHGGPRNGVYQQAISQVVPSPTGAQKRSASARSPSPSHPNKSRRTDLPTGPRAMQKDGPSNSRSLLDRMGGASNNRGNNGQSKDEIQRRIDSVTAGAVDPNMMVPPGFAGMPPPGMDMNMAAAGMVNPFMQEMFLNHMAMMAQMAASMGVMNPNMPNQGFPGPNGMPGDMSMMQGGGGGFNGGQGRGRGGARGGRGRPRGNGPAQAGSHVQDAGPATPIAAPVPVAAGAIAPSTSASTEGADIVTTGNFTIPERPASPSLCKFNVKCTNAHCRYTHASPVATEASGIVLSFEPCEQGKNCKDQDCTKAHVSPAVLKPNAEQSAPPAAPPQSRSAPQSSAVPCRFGTACTKAGCTFSHPPRHPCRYGTACTRANCTFQHPPGRVLPGTFHRGLSTNGGMVNIATPEPGSMGGASHNKSVTFNNPASMKERLKEIEEKKAAMQKAVEEAAANSKKSTAEKPVALAA